MVVTVVIVLTRVREGATVGHGPRAVQAGLEDLASPTHPRRGGMR